MPPSAHSEIRRGWLIILSASTGVMFSSIVLPYYTIGALVVPVTEEFGWTRAQFQAAILFSSGLGAITAPVIGWLCDRFGSRWIALPSLAGLSCGFLIAAAMGGKLWMLYLAYGAMALLGAGTIPVTWTRAITTSFFDQRGLALGFTLTGTGVCAIVMPHYTTWLVDHYGWRMAYIGIAALPLLVAGPIVFAWFRPHDTHSRSVQADPRTQYGLTLGEAARTFKFWILLMSILVVYMAVSGIGPNLFPAITDAGMSTRQAATIQSVFGVAIILGRLGVGYLVDRFWAPGVAALSMCLPVIGCWLLIDPPGFYWSATAALLIGIAAGAELDLMSFLAARYFGLRHYAQIYSVLYMGLAVCSGTAPLLFASIYDSTTSYAVSFAIAMGLFTLGALVVLCLGRYPPEQPAPNLAPG